MSPITPGPDGIRRLDVSNPEDLQFALSSGRVWLPVIPVAIKQYVIDQIVSGAAAVTTEQIAKFPAGLLDHINEERNQVGKPPLGGGSDEASTGGQPQSVDGVGQPAAPEPAPVAPAAPASPVEPAPGEPGV